MKYGSQRAKKRFDLKAALKYSSIVGWVSESELMFVVFAKVFMLKTTLPNDCVFQNFLS